MNRLTYKNGEKISFNKEFDSIEDAIGTISMVLFIRENEAERREQGCDQCRSCANCGNYDPICPVMPDSVVCANEERIMENKECVNFRPAGCCWSCGKELAE